MRAGVWLAGARGSVAVTTVVGALALRTGLADPVGCVTAHPELAVPGLPDVADLVFGGHDRDTSPLVKRAEQLAAAGVLPGAAAIRGSHGRLPDDPDDGPVLLCSSPRAARRQCAATEVKDILLELSGL